MPKGDRFTVTHSDRYVAEVEYSREVIVVHFTEVVSFDITTYRAIRRALNEYEGFFRMFYPGIHAAPPEDDPKLHRLLTMLGFVPIGASDGTAVWFRKFKETA